MPADINPFEPWRPRRDPDDQHSEDELRRHWQPGRRDETPSEPDEPEWYRQPRAPEPVWTPRHQPQNGSPGFIWVCVALVAAALIVWGVNGATHVSRVATAVLALWLGLLLAWPLGRRRRWYTRLAVAVAGLVGAVACWLWVPTTGGINLWRAEQVVARVRSLPAGDLAAYTAEAAERNRVSSEFGRRRGDIRAAERSWMMRTVTAEMFQAESERLRDPAAAQARLQKVNAAFRRSEHYNQVHSMLFQARRNTLDSRLSRLDADLRDLTRKGEFTAVARRAREAQQELFAEAQELSMEDGLHQRIAEIRIRNLRAHIAAATVRLDALAREQRYAEVAATGRRLVAELQPEAHKLNLEGDLGRAIDTRRRAALRRRIELAQAELQALLKKGDDEAVPRRAVEYEKELRDEAEALRDQTLGNAFKAARRAALDSRARKALAELKELLADRDYAAVARRGDRLTRELEPEAQAIGLGTTWRDPILVVRRKALAARLDQTRTQARALLEKKSYRAMGETGEKAVAELGPEAAAVGMSKEVRQLGDLCRFYARLAKEAKAEGKD
jgi:hypothetical protein